MNAQGNDRQKNERKEMLAAQVRRLKGSQVRALDRRVFKLYQALGQCAPDATTRAALMPLLDDVSDLWQALYHERDRRALVDAERKDKGEILWEVFHPRTKTPLNCSMIFDQQRHTVRTPHRKIVHGEYFSIKPEWQIATSDPLADLKAEWAKSPLDLNAFRQYARDIDEGFRRKQARQRMEVAA